MDSNDSSHRLRRRSVLSALGAGTGLTLSIGAFSGTATAWDRFDVCFRDCRELWMVVTETDIDLGGSNDPPAVAHVVVASGGSAVCRPVEFTAENATTMPDRFGDAPVVTYEVGADETILGVLEYNYNSDPEAQFADPVWCVNVNENDCVATEDTPDVFSAPCVPVDHKVCRDGDFCDKDEDDDDGEPGGPDGVEVTFDDCKTVNVDGDGELLDGVTVHYSLCYGGDDPCPDGSKVVLDAPELPLTLDDRQLERSPEDYRIDYVELSGDVAEEFVERPGDLECRFDPGTSDLHIDFQMDDREITLGETESVSTVTITGRVEFSYFGWDDETGGVDHAFLTTWATSDADIEFPDRDIERYYDVDNDTDTVTKDVEITFDVPPEVSDPAVGESIETDILGNVFAGLERDPGDTGQSPSMGDWRRYDDLTLRIEREDSQSETGVDVGDFTIRP